MGVVLGKMGRFEEAVFHFNEELRINPDYTKAKHNLDFALKKLGKKNK